MNTIFNILTSDRINSKRVEGRFIKFEVTHIDCQEPFLELYIHQDKVSDIIKALEAK